MSAFVKMRSVFKDSRELAQKLALLENELKTRLDVHEACDMPPRPHAATVVRRY
jgi:hypothetical protein